VHEPRLGCTGAYPYICHGYLGRDLLEQEGYPRHGLVCERHIGTGLTVHDIESQNLPVPKTGHAARSLEEKIICYADKFFSKTAGKLGTEKSLAEVRGEMGKFGPERLKAFDELHALFSKNPLQEKTRGGEVGPAFVLSRDAIMSGFHQLTSSPYRPQQGCRRYSGPCAGEKRLPQCYLYVAARHRHGHEINTVKTASSMLPIVLTVVFAPHPDP